MHRWLASQTSPTSVTQPQEEGENDERKSEFYNQSWAEEAVARYLFRQIQVKRIELEQALND